MLLDLINENKNYRQRCFGKQVALFIYEMVKPFWVSITVMFLTTCVWAADLSVRPYVLKVIINHVTNDSEQNISVHLVVPAAIYIFLTFLVSNIFVVYEYFVEIKMVPNLRKKIADNCFKYLLEQSNSFYQNSLSGNLANKVNDLINSVPEILIVIIDRFFSLGLALVIAVYALWQVNSSFAFLMLSWTILFFIGSLFLSKRLSYLSDLWSECLSGITGQMVDVFSNILSIKLFAREEAEKSSFSTSFDQAVKAEQKLKWFYFGIWFCYGNVFVLIQVINLYFLLKGRQDGEITAGDFVFVLTVNLSVINAFWQLTSVFSQFSKLFGKVVQALRTIFIDTEIKDKKNVKSLLVSKGEIIFDSVQFWYKDTDILFQNESVVINSGQKVGLVGYSGSGKSTFVNLILRLFDISSGTILIDNQDISNVTQQSLRSAIGLIPQEPLLFNRSLMENIRYGAINATDIEVIEAAKQANAHKFIQDLPLGYNSLVGERGVKLSGGQRQRIAIARVILKNSPILILDEATSQLDSVTENEIQVSLSKLMEKKTTIVIAHRLSTLLNMDRILVFNQGKIVEDGTHKELLAIKGLYKTLWDAQVGGFLPETFNN